MAKEGKQFSPEHPPTGELAPEKGKREKAEIAGLQDRLGTLIRSISGKSKLEVTTKVSLSTLLKFAEKGLDARKEWFQQVIHDPRTKKPVRELVHIPDQIFEVSENAAKGKAAHEAGHVIISRSGDFIPDRVMQELGFHALMDGVEERPTDQVVRERYSGAGKWVDEVRRADAEITIYESRERTQIGYIPKMTQLSCLCVYAPQYEKLGEYPEHYDPEVLEIYEEIREHVELVERTLPPEGASEEEVIEKAKERYKIVYSKIWPKMKKLVEEDLEQEKLRQMLEDMARQPSEKEKASASAPPMGDGGEGGEGEPQEGAEGAKGPLEKALEALDNEMKKELEEILREAVKKAKEREKEGGKKGETPKEAPGEEGERPTGGEEEPQPMGEEDEEGEQPTDEEGGEEEGEKPEADTTEGEAKEELAPIPIPMDELGEKLLGALQKAFSKLPKEYQEAIKERARQILKELEDALVEEFSGKLTENPPETHAEHEERIKREEEERKEKKRRREEKTEIDRELATVERRQASLEAKRSIYDRTYDEIRELDEELYKRLEEIFIPTIKRTMRLKSTGSRINLPAVFKWEAGRGAGSAALDTRIFESMHIPEKKDYTFTILVDLSGSMAGDGKIEETFKAVILLAEVLNRLGIRFELLGFQDEIIIFKTFDEELNDTIRTKISGMIAEANGENPGGHNVNNYNDDGPCLLEASEGLDKQHGKEKFLMSLSDGMPAGRRSTDWDLEKAVEHILTTTDQKLVGLGLGYGTDHVGHFYPTSLPNIRVEKLAETLGDLLEDMILHPDKYTYEEK